ncbi:methylene-fatty-acyl-phospholipid synthase, putative [Entamoeba invadens IP1]|uniref:Phosphatidylethanolamine N-methyltransferase n=1 Tax=Entamoeba invadens IP1 TaxID=370355 RepID=A0A0A1U930_ENTIV|nr:methylene-fatty-acyl-phospholipid synthase, putative [Entamoeba invadens IP1]ELP88488.1 methylene-fatty-acyl-phospholipid synthase, putative [Entamoeba invadens IP1]|eukprot:XP_004255259.1 methylene-fatty-acyl-phospholipid synthase, putative [Entamoeba invadens IP1]
MFDFVMDGYATISAFLIFASPSVWNTLGHLEYNSGKISALFKGNKENGYRLVMFIIIFMQIIRNVFYYLACIYSVPMFPAIDNFMNSVPIVMDCLAYPLFIAGWVLSLSSFMRLGFKGTYEGDCFGFLFDEMITKFPFDGTVPHPMYTGGAMLFFSSALHYRTSTGLILSIFSVMVYVVFSYLVEQPYTEQIYANKDKADKAKRMSSKKEE